MVKLLDWAITGVATAALAQGPVPPTDVMSYLERFGVFAVLVGYFLIRDHKRQTQLDTFVQQTLVGLIETTNTRLANVTNAIEKCPLRKDSE